MALQNKKQEASAKVGVGRQVPWGAGDQPFQKLNRVSPIEKDNRVTPLVVSPANLGRVQTVDINGNRTPRQFLAPMPEEISPRKTSTELGEEFTDLICPSSKQWSDDTGFLGNILSSLIPHHPHFGIDINQQITPRTIG